MKTIQILTKNNQETIEATLQSVIDLDWPIIIADLGSKDNTLDICKKYTTNILKFNKTNRSEIRNEISKEENIYIEPWETLIYTPESLKDVCYMCRILNSGVLTKEIRIWNKPLRFENPIYETLKFTKPSYSNILFIANQNNSYSLEEIQDWKRLNLLESDPYYYEAIKYLSELKYKEFINSAEAYLFKEKNSTIAISMIRYYIAMVEFGIFKKYNEAIKNLTICLSNNILMAEFWCLLGDIYFTLREFKKALCFYENAILLGNKRMEQDEWPLHIIKYDEYPNEMINKIKIIYK